MGYYVGYIIAVAAGVELEKVSFRGFNFSTKTRHDIYDIFKKAIPYVITCIIAFVILEMDTVMIGLFRVGNDNLANYNVAKKFVQKAISVNEAFLYALLPRFAIISRDNYEESKRSYRKIGFYNFGITMLVTIGMGTVLVKLIPIVYGSDFSDTKKYLLALLPAYICNGFSQFNINFLYYREKARVVSFCYGVSFVINLVMNWILLPNIGALGAAIGTVCSLIPFTVMLTVFTYREWKLVLNSVK